MIISSEMQRLTDETEGKKTYRKRKALNYTSLSDFNKSADHLLKREADGRKDSWDFVIGHAAEALLHATITGDKKHFTDTFFESDAPNKGINEKLFKCLCDGGDPAKLEQINKDGNRSKTLEKMHLMMDECIERPNRMPIPKADMRMMRKMVENLLAIRIESDFGRLPVSFFLERAEWQKEIFWEKDGILKKALPDYLFDAGDFYLLLDVKTAASFARFVTFLRSSYWIQGQHYKEGVESKGKKCREIRFLVMTKEAPQLAQICQADMTGAKQAYQRLVKRFRGWRAAGSPKKGYLPAKKFKLYINEVNDD